MNQNYTTIILLSCIARCQMNFITSELFHKKNQGSKKMKCDNLQPNCDKKRLQSIVVFKKLRKIRK